MRVKLTIKEMERTVKKIKKEEEVLKLKIKKSIEEQEPDIAKIHAESAIRKKMERINYSKAVAKFDCVSSKLLTAIKTKNVSSIMSRTVKGLDTVLGGKDLREIAKNMERFGEQTALFDEHNDNWMVSVEKTVEKETPESDVSELVEKIAEEYGLELSGMGPLIKEDSSIEDRLKKLKEI